MLFHVTGKPRCLSGWSAGNTSVKGLRGRVSSLLSGVCLGVGWPDHRFCVQLSDWFSQQLRQLTFPPQLHQGAASFSTPSTILVIIFINVAILLSVKGCLMVGLMCILLMANDI